MPQLIFDAFTLITLEWTMSQITHFYGVKFLAWKSGSVKFWTNIMSVLDWVIVASISKFYQYQLITIIIQINDDIGLGDSCWYLKAQPRHAAAENKIFSQFEISFLHWPFQYWLSTKRHNFLPLLLQIYRSGKVYFSRVLPRSR